MRGFFLFRPFWASRDAVITKWSGSGNFGTLHWVSNTGFRRRQGRASGHWLEKAAQETSTGHGNIHWYVIFTSSCLFYYTYEYLEHYESTTTTSTTLHDYNTWATLAQWWPWNTLLHTAMGRWRQDNEGRATWRERPPSLPVPKSLFIKHLQLYPYVLITVLQYYTFQVDNASKHVLLDMENNCELQVGACQWENDDNDIFKYESTC